MRFNNLLLWMRRNLNVIMPSISYHQAHLWVGQADTVFVALGRWAEPVAIVALVTSGEALRHPLALDLQTHYGTLKGIHHLAGALWAVTLALLTNRFMYHTWRNRKAQKAQRPLPFPQESPLTLLRWAWAFLCLLLAVSGLQWLLVLRVQFVVLPMPSLSAWQMVHVLSAPYFYALLVLRVHLWCKHSIPRIKHYLYSH